MQHLMMHRRKKMKAQTSLSEVQKKYDETIVKNGELTQADVDQANTDAEEAKNAVTEQECQVESAQKEADAAKQALETANRSLIIWEAHRHCRMQKVKKTTAQKKCRSG